MEKITIITAVHNQLPYNQLFYESLIRYTYHSYKLIIINNNSTDGSAEFFAATGALVIARPDNVSYSVAQNIGLEHAQTEYVAFLNNDTFLSKEWDKKLIEYLELYDLDAISPCGIENMENDRMTSSFMQKWRRVNMLQRVRTRLDLSYTKNTLLKMINRMYGNWDRFIEMRAERFKYFIYPGIMGNAIVARKSVFEKIGKWNETVAASDWDLALRLVKNQIEKGTVKGSHIAGDVFIHHFIRATFRKRRSEKSGWNNLMDVKDAYPPKDIRYLKRPNISLIIAVYNHTDFLEKVFLSLFNQTFKDFEIVVSDDGSGNDIKTLIEKYTDLFRYPIQHIWHENAGFRKTIIANKSAMHARAPYLVFIDGDCILHHRFIERHNRHKRTGAALSGRRVYLDRTCSEKISSDDIVSGKIERCSFWWKHCLPSTRRYGVYLPWLQKIRNISTRYYEILGCNFSIYKGDYFSINGYDESIIGRGLEDNNLCNRLKRGKIIIRNISNEAIQYHLFHSSDPIPHSKETIRKFGGPEIAWTKNGIIKK